MSKAPFAALRADWNSFMSMSALVRPLPSQHVTTDTIEDAYVAFILHCNPAAPYDSDTTELRQAFGNLPKSGGKTFNIYTLFTLVKQLETKELKTWAELALTLGVEPPDHTKGESAQKVQQYAVRLKRWMHSMHVDAFFEYLLDIPSPYWTDIPSSIALEERDGVSPSDDMAIRALMPTARPKRIRKRLIQEDESTETPSPRSTTYWSPTGGPTSGSYSHDMIQANQAAQTMLHTNDYDMSSSTVSSTSREQTRSDTRDGFSAPSPSTSKPRQRRHGAKVLSSAWRSRGIGANSSGKSRGRPPMNITAAKTALSPMAAPDSPHMEQTYSSPIPIVSPGTRAALTPCFAASSGSVHDTPPTAPPEFQHPTTAFQAERSSNMASTSTDTAGFVLPPGLPPPWPPVTTLQYPHCEPHPAEDIFTRTAPSPASNLSPPESQTGYSYNLDAAEAARGTPVAGAGFFDRFLDRTNLDAAFAYIVSTTQDADWFDVDGNKIQGCSIAESVAICSNLTEHLYNAAPSPSAFLINLAALLGARMLMTTTKVQMRRLGTQEGRSYYASSWEYRLGHLCGTYQMTHSIDNERLNREMGVGQSHEKVPRGAATGGEDDKVWKKRYEDAVKAMDEKDEQLADLKARMYETLRK